MDPTQVPERLRSDILEFVDSVAPDDAEVWLTGSRVRGDAHHASDWDVIAFTEDYTGELFKTNQTSRYTIDGGHIELVIAHPNHWNDPRPYMTELERNPTNLDRDPSLVMPAKAGIQ